MGCGTSSSNNQKQEGAYEPEDPNNQNQQGKQDKANAAPQPKGQSQGAQNKGKGPENPEEAQKQGETKQNNNKQINANQKQAPAPPAEPEKPKGYEFYKTDKYDPKALETCLLYKEKFDRHKKDLERLGGKNHIDIDFLGKPESLSQDPGLLKGSDKMKWKRAKDIFDMDSIRVFQKHVEPKCIQGGAIPNLYFQSALSILAERPYLIERNFLTKLKTNEGLYSVLLCIDGQFKEHIVDDMIPVDDNNVPVFTRSSEDFVKNFGTELWILILEKAYAKAFGSYQQISLGNAGEAIRDITGAPYESESTLRGDDRVWTFLQKHKEKKSIMHCGSTASTDTNQQKKLSYAIMDIKEIEVDGAKQQLVKIKEPWGKFEWKGDWSNTSDKWTPELKAEVNFQEDQKDQFWMPLREFNKAFYQVNANVLVEDYLYTSLRIKLEKDYMSFVKIHVKYDDTQVYFSLSQKDERHYVRRSSYTYSHMRLMITNVDFTEFVGHTMDKKKDIMVEVKNLKQGVYYAYIEMDWSSNRNDADTVVLSAYSSDQVQFDTEYEIADDETAEELNQMLAIAPLEEPDKIYKYPQTPEVTRVLNYCCGYFYFRFQNKSKEKTLQEVVDVDDINNMRICHPYKLSSMFRVTVKPGRTKVVRYRITSTYKDNYSYKANFNGGIELDDEGMIEEAKVKGHDDRKQRGEYNVFYYPYFYSKGYALVHWNKEEEGNYEEEMELQLTNLILREDEYNDNPTLKINLRPGEACIHRIDIKDKKEEFSYKTSLYFKLKKN